MEKTNNTMLVKLVNNIGIKTIEDGTTRGTFARLSKADFTSEQAYNAYKLELAYAAVKICDSLKASATATGAAEEAAKHRNYARQHVQAAYDIIKAELQAQSGLNEADGAAFIVRKKHMRAWIATGTFAKLATDYAAKSSAVKMKSAATLQRVVEMDISRILNHADRELAIVSNDRDATFIAKQEQAKADAARAEAMPAEQPAKVEKKPAKKSAKTAEAK